MTSPTEALVEFAAGRCEPTDEALAVARLSLIDWLVCGRAGLSEEVAAIMRAQAKEEAGQEASTLFGGGQVPARMAALVNGTISHALDYDDTHFAHIGHPSVAVFPATLALAEKQGASGSDFLQSALMGLEASIRFGIWLGKEHYQAGFHQTATAGAVGATIAACSVLRLSSDESRNALGYVSTRMAGLKSQFGTMGKPLNAGQAAANGVEAAELAARGFLPNEAGLECAQGFGPTHHGEGDADAFDGMGGDWHFETVSHKFHACCHGTHAMIEALTSLPEIEPGKIKGIAVETHPRWMSVCNIPEPASGLEIKFSYRMVAALVILGYDTAAPSTFDDALTYRPAMRDLSSRVQVSTSDVAETASRIRVELHDGEILESAHDLASAQDLSQRTERIYRKARSVLGPAADPIIEAASGSTLDTSRIADLMAG